MKMRKKNTPNKVCIAGVLLTTTGIEIGCLDIHDPGIAKLAEMNNLSRKEIWKIIADDLKALSEKIMKEVGE